MKKVLIFSMCAFVFFTGCDEFWFEPDPAAFTKEKATRRAEVELRVYANRYGIDESEFTGPYYEEGIGLDFPTYTVCYKHPIHYFCYGHWVDRADAGPKSEIEELTPTMEWLEKQP